MFNKRQQCQACWFYSRKDGVRVCANKDSMYYKKATHQNEGCCKWENKIKGKDETAT